jgi:hypothetical protein
MTPTVRQNSQSPIENPPAFVGAPAGLSGSVITEAKFRDTSLMPSLVIKWLMALGEKISRPEAIRRLVEVGLKAKGK